MKKKIKIDFVDFWPDLVKEKNYFTDILEKYYDVEISPDPDYLFCSYFDNRHLAFRSCVKIYFIGENMVPDFNLYDYAMGFHNISFEDRYLRLPLYALYKEDYELVRNKHTFSDEYYLSKKGFCNCVISNPYPFADRRRDAMYEALSAYKSVGSGGRYNNNVGGPVKDKIAFEKEYNEGKFCCLSMEEYTDLVRDCIAKLPENIVIHRMTGDGARRDLIAPLWSTDKKRVINMLRRKLDIT